MHLYSCKGHTNWYKAIHLYWISPFLPHTYLPGYVFLYFFEKLFYQKEVEKYLQTSICVQEKIWRNVDITEMKREFSSLGNHLICLLASSSSSSSLSLSAFIFWKAPSNALASTLTLSSSLWRTWSFGDEGSIAIRHNTPSQTTNISDGRFWQIYGARSR